MHLTPITYFITYREGSYICCEHNPPDERAIGLQSLADIHHAIVFDAIGVDQQAGQWRVSLQQLSQLAAPISGERVADGKREEEGGRKGRQSQHGITVSQQKARGLSDQLRSRCVRAELLQR